MLRVTDENNNVISNIIGPSYTYSLPNTEGNQTIDYSKVRWNGDDLEECLKHVRDKEDPVSNPPHYNKHPSGIECIEVTRHMNFNLGNAIKYIWRADLKSDALEDLKKAAWYIQDEIQRREKEMVAGSSTSGS